MRIALLLILLLPAVSLADCTKLGDIKSEAYLNCMQPGKWPAVAGKHSKTYYLELDSGAIYLTYYRGRLAFFHKVPFQLI